MGAAMKTSTTLMAFLFVSSLGLWGQPVDVQFVDGMLEVRRGSAWHEVFIGDSLAGDSTVRLAENSTAELASGGNVIALHDPGLYRLADLLATSRQVATWDMSSVVGSKLSAMGGKAARPDEQAAQMGVRGEARGEANLTWMDDEAEQLRKEALELMEKGDYGQAHQIFLEAVDFALDEEEAAEYSFYAAYAAEMGGDRPEAVRLLSGLEVGPEEPFYDDYAPFVTRISIESLAFSQGLALAKQYLAEKPQGPQTQTMLLLAAFAHRGLGDNAGFRESLEKARSLDPSSEQGRAAAHLLQ
jgi:tetratricopeptide (TPR) repeat protein